MSGKDSFSAKPVPLRLYLAGSGFCSRRKATEIILAGQVTVNGNVQGEPSFLICPASDDVRVGRQRIEMSAKEYIVFNKPRNCVTTRSDPHAAKTVYDFLPESLRRLHPVGRLDKDTEGLLLLTNDGSLTHALTHPRKGVDKVYRVRIHGSLKPSARQMLEKGMPLEGRKTAPAKIRHVQSEREHTVFEFVIHEGRKRQVRRMLERLGYPVVHLKRLAVGPIRLGGLKNGAYRRLRAAEMEALKKISA